ncbi:MAG: hypothetical protein KIS67_20845 [Verrucomicrobiae bacterium]|nr:hypothetical protein [Verrucomicrobiae bacterium]
MKTILQPRSFKPLVIALAFGVSASIALARPYATSLTNSGGIISFRLNADADNVKIIHNGGAATNDLGPLPKGLNSVPLDVSGDYLIQVSKASGPGYPQGVVNQISDDANNLVKFANQRGLVVNKRPSSPYFGRIYVSVAAAGTAGGRSVSDGIYLLNADQTDAVGQGDTPRTGGLVFDIAAASAESPGRLALGPDDNLYIADWSDANGGLTMTDADVATNAIAGRVLPDYGGPVGGTNNHGSISSVWVEGSLAGGDLVVYSQDEDLGSFNGVYRYDIGAGPLPYTGPEVLAFNFGIAFNGILTKIVRGPDGKWYGSNRRADNATAPGIMVMDEFGTPLWDSLTGWRTVSGDPGAFDIYFSEMRGFDVSPDGKYLAGLKAAATGGANPLGLPANTVILAPMIDGIPDLANIVTMPTPGTVSIGREVTFDAVGNLYTVSSGQGLLRIYSPGGFSIVTTGSDGTLAIYSPTTEVTVTTDTNAVYEEGATTAALTITRTGELDEPLTVELSIEGTAVRGADYVLRTNSVVLTEDSVIIPAGQPSIVVTLAAINDTEAELTETVIVSLAGGTTYTTASPSSQTLVIVDNETPQLQVVSLSTNIYERLAYDYANLALRRLGDTNVFLQLDEANLVLSGSAVLNTDYAVANLPAYIDPGVVNTSIRLIYPIDNAVVDGARTVTVGLQAGTGFTAATNTATTTITDDDRAPETVLFAETFTYTDSITNWTVYYADTNTVAPANDANILFGFDYYSFLAIPPAPSSAGDTFGLLLQVNKLDGIPGAAAVNVYPRNRSFAGDYALRFDMYMIVGTVATTEYSLFGINHSGTMTNWFRNSAGGVPAGWTFDGLFYGVETDAAALGDYVLYSSPTTAGNNPTALTPGRNASTLTQVFKAPPFRYAGAPSNPNFSLEPSWVDVEVSQVGQLVTLKMNNIVIMSYTNTTPYTSGNVMLGFVDAYDSIGTDVAAAVIFDNVRVVDLTQPTVTITAVKVVGGNVEIDFTGPASAAASEFVLQEAATVNGTYGDVSATVTGSNGNFKAVRAVGGSQQFYRIKRQ